MGNSPKARRALAAFLLIVSIVGIRASRYVHGELWLPLVVGAVVIGFIGLALLPKPPA